MGNVEQLVTAEQLKAHPGRCELVRGEIIDMSPAGDAHGDIAMLIGAALLSFVKAHRLGKVYAAETGFYIERDPDTVRAPDASFVRKSRIPPGGFGGFISGPPDLAVEVLSPDDRPGEVAAKVQTWLDSGCSLVWVVDPKARAVSVHRRGRKPLALTATGNLSGEDVLPGLALPIADIFEE